LTFSFQSYLADGARTRHACIQMCHKEFITKSLGQTVRSMTRAAESRPMPAQNNG